MFLIVVPFVILYFFSNTELLLRTPNERIVFISIYFSKIRKTQNLLIFTPDIHDGTRDDIAMMSYYNNNSIYLSSRKCSLPHYSILRNITKRNYDENI